MQLKMIERNDQRVLTSAQLAEIFGTDLKRINYNFTYNKERYEEGKHFFVLTGAERKEFVYEHEIHASLKTAHTIYLWTEKGVFLHAKSLGTDQAWNAYSALVDDYFKKTEQLQKARIPSEAPKEIEDILILALGSMKEMKSEIKRLQLVVDNEIVLTTHQKSEIQQAVDRRQGELNREGYAQAHFQGIYKTLKTHFNVSVYSEIKRSDFEKALKIISGWYPKKAGE